MTTSFDPNITDVALIFEGGGMRAAYTAAVVTRLLEEGINFGAVYGISAGSSHTVNYVSRDSERARASFTDLVLISMKASLPSLKELMKYSPLTTTRLPPTRLKFTSNRLTATQAKHLSLPKRTCPTPMS